MNLNIEYGELVEILPLLIRDKKIPFHEKITKEYRRNPYAWLELKVSGVPEKFDPICRAKNNWSNYSIIYNVFLMPYRESLITIEKTIEPDVTHIIIWYKCLNSSDIIYFVDLFTALRITPSISRYQSTELSYINIMPRSWVVKRGGRETDFIRTMEDARSDLLEMFPILVRNYQEDVVRDFMDYSALLQIDLETNSTDWRYILKERRETLPKKHVLTYL